MPMAPIKAIGTPMAQMGAAGMTLVVVAQFEAKASIMFPFNIDKVAILVHV